MLTDARKAPQELECFGGAMEVLAEHAVDCGERGWMRDSTITITPIGCFRFEMAT